MADFCAIIDLALAHKNEASQDYDQTQIRSRWICVYHVFHFLFCSGAPALVFGDIEPGKFEILEWLNEES